MKVASEPDAVLPVLRNLAYRFKRIGLEAELPAVCVETRHMQARLKAQINDARGIAQMAWGAAA